MDNIPNCPFCPFSDADSYFVVQHVELCHPETGNSPFIIKDDDGTLDTCEKLAPDEAGVINATSEDDYVDCECGECVLLAEFNGHLEMHMAEGAVISEDGGQSAIGYTTFSHSSDNTSSVYEMQKDPSNSSIDIWQAPAQVRALQPDPILARTASWPTRIQQRPRRDRAWKDLLYRPSFTGTSPRVRNQTARRLGRTELGPHANENQMPTWLRDLLERGPRVTVSNTIGACGQLIRAETVANETGGVIPVIAQLCEQDRSVAKVLLCHPDVLHVSKLAREGGFCGYRNLQMLISHIQSSKAPGYEHFLGRLPTIFQLQDLIEDAWNKGFKTSGRVETGGIRGTRKYIGTPEVEALLLSLGIGHTTKAYTRNETPIPRQVYRAMEGYFMEGLIGASDKVCRTSLPPLYFQHHGHSLTVIGIEQKTNGAYNLLVFDPMFKPSPAMCRLIGTTVRASSASGKLLKAYRRGDDYLEKYKSIEILQLTSLSSSSYKPPK